MKKKFHRVKNLSVSAAGESSGDHAYSKTASFQPETELKITLGRRDTLKIESVKAPVIREIAVYRNGKLLYTIHDSKEPLKKMKFGGAGEITFGLVPVIPDPPEIPEVQEG